MRFRSGIRALLPSLALAAMSAHAFDFRSVVLGAKFSSVRSHLPFSSPAPTSKPSPGVALDERFVDATFGGKSCHVVVTTTHADNVVQNILVYWSGDSQSVLDTLAKKYGQPAQHFRKNRYLNGRNLADTISIWRDDAKSSLELHTMDGEAPYMTLSTPLYSDLK